MAWERRRYRRNKVWIEVDERGRPVLDERGLAALRYKPEDERTYTVRPDEIRALEDPPAAEPAGEAPPPSSPEAIEIWTDGASSGNPGPAGVGAVLLWRGRRREIQRYLGRATNNEAELTAVLVALRALRRRDLPVRLHTDSSYAIGVLAGGHRARANPELVQRIRREMERFSDLRLLKVAGHAGVPENERADALARAAIRSGAPPTGSS